MGDLKSFWNDAPVPDVGLDGDTVTSRGSDPQVSLDGSSGLKAPLWPDPSVPTPDGSESANSVSGLPSLPNRFEPSATPPDPPSLEDKNPGTIDGGKG